MKFELLIIFFAICLCSCEEYPPKTSANKVRDTTKSAEVKKIEPDLTDVKTALGHIIKYKRTGDSFQVQWFQNGQLKTLTGCEFQVCSADAWIPRFKSENENYLLLKAGCGNPCWMGFFLPLNGDQQPNVIHEYLAYDLDQNYVAQINYDLDSIEVLNLKSNKTQRFKTGNCKSAFKGYCFDTMYFDKKCLKYSWDSAVDWSSKTKRIIKLKLKI